MRWMTQLTREQAALKCVYLGHHEPGPHRERATTLDQPPSSLRHHLRRAPVRRRAVPMRTQEQRHVRLGFPFLAGQDRPPLVGVKVVPPRPAKNTGLRGLHLDTSHAAGAKTGSYEEGKELRVWRRIALVFTPPERS